MLSIVGVMAVPEYKYCEVLAIPQHIYGMKTCSLLIMVKVMSNLFEDKEIDRIKKAKISAMLQRAQNEKLTNKLIILTDSNFHSEVSKHRLIVVDFWAPWCGPCRMVGPLVEELAAEYAGKVTFGKLNVDDNTIVPSRFGVRGIPTLIVFKDGEAVDTLVGACPKSHIESKFRPYI
jgi:thioredoxin 1